MTLPQRAKVHMFPRLGIRTIGASCLAICGIVLVSIATKNVSNGLFFAVFVPLTLLVYLAAHFDRKARTKRFDRELRLHDFSVVPNAELEGALLGSYRNIKPNSLGGDCLYHAFRGVRKGRHTYNFTMLRHADFTTAFVRDLEQHAVPM